jgi:GT2 family glycosyltransferase
MNVRDLLTLMRAPVCAGRLGLLRAAVALGEAGRTGPARPVLRATWAPGISVVVPERGTPLLLKRALVHLRAALGRIAEPWEVIVVVNGEPARTYADLRAGFSEVRWFFHEQALGFGGALECGLAAARFGGIYLHNSDMVLEENALATLLPWRAGHVFAIASQIFFDDPQKRREETGWGDLRLRAGRAELFDRTPEPDGLVRGSLYAGGGSSLFDAALLKCFAAGTKSYAPFYWEDVDWGLQAWRNGLEVLFHPGSVAWHRHRATISRCYPADEVERIIARNGVLFELRNFPVDWQVLQRTVRANEATTKELTAPTSLAEIRTIRQARRRVPFPNIDVERTTRRYYGRPVTFDGRPLVLVVSPSIDLPRQDDDARHTRRLCEDLRDHCRYILLSDESAARALSDTGRIGPFESVHLVGEGPKVSTNRGSRSLSRERAAAELDRLVAVHCPDYVQMAYSDPLARRIGNPAPPTPRGEQRSTS